MDKLAEFLAAAIPYRLRRAHKAIALALGYFWLPCSLCGEPYGGHEWRDIGGNPSYVWLRQEGPGVRSKGICPKCTKAGLGVAHPRPGEYPGERE